MQITDLNYVILGNASVVRIITDAGPGGLSFVLGIPIGLLFVGGGCRVDFEQ
jgi:hypothetical protein